MRRDLGKSFVSAGLTGALLVAVGALQSAGAALDPTARLQLDNAVIDNPGAAASIAAEAVAGVCPQTGASAGEIAAGLADVREIFRTVAERAIIEEDPTDPAPAAAIAEAVINACPAAVQVVASELEALIQTAAGGGLPAPGPGEQSINANSPIEQNREAFEKSPGGFTSTRLGPVDDVLQLFQAQNVLSETQPRPD